MNDSDKVSDERLKEVIATCIERDTKRCLLELQQILQEKWP